MNQSTTPISFRNLALCSKHGCCNTTARYNQSINSFHFKLLPEKSKRIKRIHTLHKTTRRASRRTGDVRAVRLQVLRHHASPLRVHVHVRQVARAGFTRRAPHWVSRCVLESGAGGRTSESLGRRGVSVHVCANALWVLRALFFRPAGGGLIATTTEAFGWRLCV